MISRTECPKCASKRIIPNAHLYTTNPQYGQARLTVVVPEHPNALLFRGAHISYPTAWICGTCGFTELYVDNPEELYAAYTTERTAETSNGS